MRKASWSTLPALKTVTSHWPLFALAASAGPPHRSRYGRAREYSRTAADCAWLRRTKAGRGPVRGKIAQELLCAPIRWLRRVRSLEASTPPMSLRADMYRQNAAEARQRARETR